jgi:rfaE bifunctional protein kinase chain/domain
LKQQAPVGRLVRRRLEGLIGRFSRVRLLVIGDVVLDEYLRGAVDRVSPEAPVPVVHVQGESGVLGGAGNVVRNVAALGGDCTFCSVVGDDADGRRVVELVEELGVESGGLIRVAGRPTTRKTRVVARSQQIVRVDRETHEPIPARVVTQLARAIGERLAGLDGAILEDYGKGMLTGSSIRKIMKSCIAAGVPVAVDPKTELRPFRGATLLKPNLREAEELTGISAGSPRGLERIARKLRNAVGESDLIITRGADGMAIFEGPRGRRDVPTIRQEVYDVQGAGDTTIAILSLALGAGASLLEAAVLANAGAGVVVEKTGTATVSPEELRAVLPAALDAAREALR